jgi:hypothetical protein
VFHLMLQARESVLRDLASRIPDKYPIVFGRWLSQFFGSPVVCNRQKFTEIVKGIESSLILREISLY